MMVEFKGINDELQLVILDSRQEVSGRVRNLGVNQAPMEGGETHFAFSKQPSLATIKPKN